MTVRHCPGCPGYTRSWHAECPGIDTAAGLDGEFTVPDVVPPLALGDRIRVLFGRPVLLGMRAGPVGEPFEVVLPDAGEWKA